MDAIDPHIGAASGSTATGVAAGSNHTCAVVDGGAKCWGASGNGQLRINPGWSPAEVSLLAPLYLPFVRR